MRQALRAHPADRVGKFFVEVKNRMAFHSPLCLFEKLLCGWSLLILKVCFIGIVSGDNFLMRPHYGTLHVASRGFSTSSNRAWGGKQKAEILARTLETAIGAIQQRAKEEILEQKQLLRIALKDDLKHELVTRELFDERFKVIEEKFASLNFKLNLFIAIALAALTFANPTFM